MQNISVGYELDKMIYSCFIHRLFFFDIFVLIQLTNIHIVFVYLYIVYMLSYCISIMLELREPSCHYKITQYAFDKKKKFNKHFTDNNILLFEKKYYTFMLNC